MSNSTESPVALITGGATGIGAAAARQLLGAGHRVAVTGRRKERLDALAEELGGPEGLLTIVGNASEYADVQAAVDSTLKAFGRLDTVVANAGVATHDTVADGDPAGWTEMVLTNVLGPALLVRASVDALKETRGRIVLVGSVAGFVNGPGNIYGATKWAVTGLAENTRRQVTEFGIGVTLIAPGRVETPFWDGMGSLPPGHLLTADQLAESIVWAIRQPEGVDVNTVVVRPIGQPN
ncbi:MULTISPECIES: SDR family oxidoreductase [unclassified Streptomyces]|uniref:SDR family oxidoreductase n=1 Tax=unclassified Streptomyces TaxID=2593676 RepID=UPI00225201B6|nr:MULTISPECIES: SDR family NAD(P)-dependent oxidoreductase [unclassified Streptomyces]MCX5052759.1 SDR family NAD(P)-dependent oxidoreductase [Streptomyces sp. NBC_00474]MCX5062581.1 SDR family NAD(P)-dependent oxidoreductase [Streptomyces sp. NBC_00452]MCX5250211.1 SDR family NAD(P)-dependent oxidoreductase [Streptomyces sp. NBC_00201]MCX5291811.1 SDR family NAD(P)-dependent oxidoreductase [Streptomyces sp. NBC_00183]